MKPEINRVKWPIVLFTYAAVIFLLSSMPADSLPSVSYGWDKVFHFFLYLGFGFVLVKAIDTHFKFKNNFILWGVSLLCGCVYALSDEIHQIFVAQRVFSMTDFCADAAGIVLSLGLFKILR